MTTRYFKFTNGQRTWFRASQSRVYVSGWHNQSGFGFSAKPGQYPAEEIDDIEYKQLVELKNARLGPAERDYTQPYHSWVRNEEIEAARAPVAAPKAPAVDPTKATYTGLTQAYDYFNARLFGAKLPHCLITLHRHKGAFGYFSGERFGTRDGAAVTDEIALNPSHILHRSTGLTLSTLVHEMCHLEQHHFGKPSRTGYHNKEWADMMRQVGLIPSDTGAPGGKETGQKVSHYVEPGGAFDVACTELLGQGFEINYGERGGNEAARAKKRASKTKFTCPECGQNCWGKPDSHLICGDCNETMEEA